MKSHQVRGRHASTENIIDLTLDPSSPLAGQTSVRWTSFRSGHVDIRLLPLSNDSRASPLELNTDPRPSLQQEPAHLARQHENMPFVRSNDTKSYLARPNMRTNETAPVRLVEDRRIDRSLFDQFHQHGALEAARSSYSGDYSAVPADEVEIFPSSPDCSPLVRGFTCGKLPLSLGSYDKPRRVLHDDDSAYVVTAHGVIDQIRATGVLNLDRNIRSPPLPLEELVDDACILSHQGEPVIVLGHAREQNQITVLNLGHSQVNISVQ